MIKDFIASVLGDYRRLIVTEILLVACLLGGFLIAFLLLSIILIHVYPAYVWCVLGGFIAIWFIVLFVLYAYVRIIKAESKARLAQFQSIEHYASIFVSTIMAVIECRRKSKKRR